uniref:Alternative protein C6orf106 n=1 Tax=Homo sapiens TaxID=9606 RepID=L8EB61_HUMAN|nr:alternative protein C6orf106 [Homo sapiens]
MSQAPCLPSQEQTISVHILGGEMSSLQRARVSASHGVQAEGSMASPAQGGYQYHSFSLPSLVWVQSNA